MFSTAAAIGCLMMHSILELLLSAFVRVMRTPNSSNGDCLCAFFPFRTKTTPMKFVIACSMQSFSLFLSWLLHVTLKLCSIVFECLARLVTTNSMRFCDALIACGTNGNGSISFISSTHHTIPYHTSPRHFLMLGRLLANKRSYMERWLSFADVFRYFRRAAWE